MPLDKIYECICDNPKCLAAMWHSGIDWTKEFTKQELKKIGCIVKGDKCYCDQKCYDTRND